MEYFYNLGVTNKSSNYVIKKAFHKLALLYHPDRNSNSNDIYNNIYHTYSQMLSDKNNNSSEFLQKCFTSETFFYKGYSIKINKNNKIIFIEVTDGDRIESQYIYLEENSNKIISRDGCITLVDIDCFEIFH